MLFAELTVHRLNEYMTEVDMNPVHTSGLERTSSIYYKYNIAVMQKS